MYDLLIKNGTVVTPENTGIKHIYVRDEKIVAVTSELLNEPVKKTIDAAGLYVYPGFIDTHVHSRDGGSTHKEDFYHSTRAAAAGGITTIFEMPNAVPAVVDKESFQAQKANLLSKANVDFAMWGLCIGALNNDKLMELSECGVGAFKFFWGYAIDQKTYSLIYNYDPADSSVIPPFDDGEVYGIFQAVAKTGKPIAIHAENADLIKSLTANIRVEDYENEFEALLACRPNLAEELVVNTAIQYSRETGARLHILHISAKETVDMVKRAQKEQIPVTGETCPHYLYLTNEDYDRIGSMIKCYPPVRRKEDQKKLWEGLEDGTLMLVCSDHAPHTPEEKEGSLFKIPSGMCGLETLVPLMLQAVNDGRISRQQLASVLSEEPAKMFGIYPRKGSLETGTDADISIVDFDREYEVHKEDFQSVSKVTAFDGMKIKGKPVYTILRGNVIMENGKVKEDTPIGRFIKA
ncbi:MAG: allantoinase AllB [Roseburia sp.]|nr:allantoinase AllB [Roseburia sp.]